MRLSESENNLNGRELAEIKQAILTETSVANTSAQQETLVDLLAVTQRMFGHKGLLLSDLGKQSLAFLLHDAIKDNLSKKQYKKQLQQWVEITYPALLKQAEDEQQILYAQQPLNLTRTLVERGQADARAWGDDADIRTVLGSEIVHPEAVTKAGTYILPPVSVVAGNDASEQEIKSPHTFLQNHLETVCQRNPESAIRVLVPVNCGQMHWMLFQADLKNGKVESAQLSDSMSGASQDALSNVAKAVKEFGCNKVESIARKVQSNGYSCMDYTVQKALQEKYASVDNVQDAGLKEIYAAESAEDLRSAVVDTIIRHDIRLANNETLVASGAKNAFSRDVKPDQLKEVLNAALTCPADKTISKMIVDNTKKLQINFDEVLAKKLDALYKDVANESKSDEVLFDQARVVAYQETRRKFGLFDGGVDAAGPQNANTSNPPRP